MKVRYQSVSGGCIGEVELPTSTPGVIVVKAHGCDRPEALARAAAVAARIAEDPIMQVIMSPKVRADLDELRLLASAAQEGPEAIREVMGELGASKRKMARDMAKHNLKVRAKRADNDDDGDGGDNGGNYPPPPPGYEYEADIVNGRGPEIAGFWDDVQNAATKVGTAAWEAARAHRKEIAMAGAAAFLGPAGAVAAGKAVDLLTAAQEGHPEAQKAASQVARKAAAGDPKAKVMASVMKAELNASAQTAAKAGTDAPPGAAAASTTTPAPPSGWDIPEMMRAAGAGMHPDPEAHAQPDEHTEEQHEDEHHDDASPSGWDIPEMMRAGGIDNGGE